MKTKRNILPFSLLLIIVSLAAGAVYELNPRAMLAPSLKLFGPWLKTLFAPQIAQGDTKGQPFGLRDAQFICNYRSGPLRQ